MKPAPGLKIKVLNQTTTEVGGRFVTHTTTLCHYDVVKVGRKMNKIIIITIITILIVIWSLKTFKSTGISRLKSSCSK